MVHKDDLRPQDEFEFFFLPLCGPLQGGQPFMIRPQPLLEPPRIIDVRLPQIPNAILNYGYTILCSAFTRILGLHGYHTGLGIHHFSRDNPVNLSCDMMEPFRPLVDRIAFEHWDEPLAWELKKLLIAIPNKYCLIDGKRMQVDMAAEIFVLETIKAVEQGKEVIPEVRFD